MGHKKYKFQFYMLLPVILLSVILSLLPATRVQASDYHSWIREGESAVYSNVGTEYSDPDKEEDEDPLEDVKADIGVKHIVNLIKTFCKNIFDACFTYDNPRYKLDLSGIVMGRLVGYDVSILKFELFEDNPWGIVGAYGYVFIRNIIYGLMFLYAGILLTKQLLHNGAKGRAELKATAETILFMFVLLYIMPWFVNIFTIMRDAITLGFGELLQGKRGLDIQESISLAKAQSSGVDIFLSLLQLATFFAPLFYVVGYALIAMQETGLFIAFPMVALLSIREKKLLNSWCGMFFSNLAVPLIDYVFLLMPIILKNVLKPQSTETASYAVVALCCVFSVQPARNAILRLFGNMGGAQANIGGMAALGMAAMRMMGGGKGGAGSSGGSSASSTDDLTNAQRFENLAGGFNEALTETNRATEGIRSLEDIDAIGGGLGDGNMSLSSVDEEALVNGDSYAEKDTPIDTRDVMLPGGDAPDDVDVMMGMDAGELADVDSGELMRADAGELADMDAGELMHADAGELMRADAGELMRADAGGMMRADAGELTDIGNAGMDASISQKQEYVGAKSKIGDEPVGETVTNQEEMDEALQKEAVEPSANMETPQIPTAEDTVLSEEEVSFGQRVRDFWAKNQEPSQREQYQVARMDNLQKLDQARDKLNEQDAVIANAQAEFTNASGNHDKMVEQREANKKRIEAIGKELATSEKYVGDYDEQLKTYSSMTQPEKAAFDKRFSDIETHRTNVRDLTAERDTLTADNQKLTNKIEHIERSDSFKQAESKLNTAKVKKAALQEVIERREGAERAYATMMKGQGGSGDTYANAREFANASKLQDIRKSQTNWRNFDSHASADVLSPDEIAKYYRQRARHKQVEGVIGKTAKTVGAVVGATAAMYGGPSAMLTGGMLGSGWAEGGANKVIEHHNDKANFRQAKKASGKEGLVTKTVTAAKDRLKSSREYAEQKRQEKSQQQATHEQTAHEQNSKQGSEQSPIKELASGIEDEVRANAERDNITFK